MENQYKDKEIKTSETENSIPGADESKVKDSAISEDGKVKLVAEVEVNPKRFPFARVRTSRKSTKRYAIKRSR